MSRGRDEWLARRARASKVVPKAVASSATAARLMAGGWYVTVRGQGLVPLGVPGSVEVGGVPLENVRFAGTTVTGRLRELPPSAAVVVDLGVSRVPAVPLRTLRMPLLLAPEQAAQIGDGLRRLARYVDGLLRDRRESGRRRW